MNSSNEIMLISNSVEYLGIEKPVNKITPLVSVMVITYLHEKYIAKCLDSILNQKVNFDYEIVIGEDCSSDRTRDICIEYAKKNPNKIRLHLRDRKHTSVYNDDGSFRRSLNSIFTLKSCRGKFIAICEGDDYWTDENKLQEQYDLLENNHNINLCYHAHQEFNETTKKITNVIIDCKEPYKLFTPNEVILGGGSMMATCSLFFRSEVVANLPSWFSQVPAGDYFIQILASLNGGAIYINKNYSVYRTGQSSSWSSRIKLADAILVWFKQICLSLESLNDYTSNKYSAEINKIKAMYSIIVLANCNIDINYRKKLFSIYRHQLGFGFKIRWLLLYRNVGIHNTYLKFRGIKLK